MEKSIDDYLFGGDDSHDNTSGSQGNQGNSFMSFDEFSNEWDEKKAKKQESSLEAVKDVMRKRLMNGNPSAMIDEKKVQAMAEQYISINNEINNA
ncbi:hypothetical protein VCHA38O209_140025 [Vibrio chagasii]|nr:hypothetical protein VCHA38O209_140025 [Vibrio chagasii]